MGTRIETLESLKAVADLVGTELHPATVDQIQVPEPIKVEALDMDGLFISVNQVNKFMPRMVDELLTLFFKGNKYQRKVKDEDGDVVTDGEGNPMMEDYYIPLSPNEKRGVFTDLAKFSLTDDRLKKEFGLIRDAANANGGSVNLNVLNITQLRELPQGAVDDELRRLANGTAL
jgi:hypothetical protein